MQYRILTLPPLTIGVIFAASAALADADALSSHAQRGYGVSQRV